MAYTQNTPEDIAEMLAAIGVGSVDDLFEPIPEAVRLGRPLDIPGALSEPEILRHLGEKAARNVPLSGQPSFLGAGIYRHHIPSIVDALASRSEFATSYTPYQPEASQGTLEAIFEYQTMICQLTGMDVSNASHYDGATSAAEAALMTVDATRRSRVLYSAGLHPHAKAVLRTYADYSETGASEIPLAGGRLDLDALRQEIGEDVAGVILQTPNFYGNIEEATEVGRIVREAGALLVASVDPISLGLLAPPGSYGADIAVGEGQAIGNPVSYGGPYFGFLAARERHLRKMPGRIAGRTTDAQGRTAYVLTLQAREQHIRRAKATSNICTNQGLCALRGAIYLTALGKQGLREVAELSLRKAHYAAEAIEERTVFRKVHEAPFFREFAIEGPVPASEANRRLLEAGIIGGYDLGRDDPAQANRMLLAFTELNTRADIDRLIAALGEIT